MHNSQNKNCKKKHNQKDTHYILHQIQIENGGNDIVQYATACSDEIPDLQGFKDICKPVFLLMAEGKLVAFVHGANAGSLKEMMFKEVGSESAVRNHLKLEDAVPQSEMKLDNEQAEEENRKANMKTLKNSILKKRIFK